MKPIRLSCLFLVLMFVAAGGQEKQTKSLHQAAADGDVEQVEALLSKGADVNAKDDYGQTPLHCAVYKGYRNVAVYLLENGASVDPKDNAGRTPLHYAVGAGKNRTPGTDHQAVAQLLLDKGADINAKDKWGWTALHYAVRMANKAMVGLLVNKGAELNATNDRGGTALSMARRMSTLLKGHPRQSEAIGKYSEIADLLGKGRRIYYVATGGKDSNPGTLQYPFKTFGVAIEVAEPGDTILVRKGTYHCSTTIHIDKSGEQSKPIRVSAYCGENPVFDFSAAKGDGFLVKGAYWHIKGLTVTRAECMGILLETKGAHHNILEQIIAYANGLQGICLLNGPARNLVLNCDSYRNFDPETDGENADGFAAGRSLSKGNVFIGCRAWNNSDDGYDFGFTDEGVRLESCYAYRNGKNIWGHPCFTGNANGFKLWPAEIPHVLIRCAAWDHPRSGFAGTLSGVRLYNCTAFRNRLSYIFQLREGNMANNVFRNNLSVYGRVFLKPQADDQHNSWNAVLNLNIAGDDFLSLDDSIMTQARNPDGSIPESDFLRFAPGSDAIDRGDDVGLPFVGKAPDLGAFEYNPAAEDQSYVKILHQVVRDHDLEKIRKMVTEGTDVNEKDWLGYAPLHWAIYFGYLDLVELLLDNGADPNLKSDTGRTPLEIAKAMEYTELVEFLRKHGAKE